MKRIASRDYENSMYSRLPLVRSSIIRIIRFIEINLNGKVEFGFQKSIHNVFELLGVDCILTFPKANIPSAYIAFKTIRVMMWKMIYFKTILIKKDYMPLTNSVWSRKKLFSNEITWNILRTKLFLLSSVDLLAIWNNVHVIDDMEWDRCSVLRESLSFQHIIVDGKYMYWQYKKRILFNGSR